jgi:hypothetical protein
MLRMVIDRTQYRVRSGAPYLRETLVPVENPTLQKSTSYKDENLYNISVTPHERFTDFMMNRR